MLQSIRRNWAWALLIASVAGCQSPTHTVTVTGTVAYQEVSVKRGFITFMPIDGHGSTRGGEIADGNYSVANVLTGRYRVAIISRPEAVIEPAGKNDKAYPKLVPAADAIPADAVGNHQVVDVSPDNSTFHFKLRSPAAR